MNEDQRAVLERVARGEITPAEGAALLDELEGKAPDDERDPRDWAADYQPGVGRPEPSTQTTDRAQRIRLARAAGVAVITGDPSISEAVAEGPHLARREGDALVIERQDVDWWGLGDMSGFAFSAGPGQVRVRHRGRHRHWGYSEPLRVRVNPDLPLEVEGMGCRIQVRSVHGPIRAAAQAGSIDIVDFRSPLDLSVQAGSIRARGVLDRGESHVRCEAGSVRIDLARGSSVRVSAHAVLGKVDLDNRDVGDPWVIGGGEGTLDIETTMGGVRVTVDR